MASFGREFIGRQVIDSNGDSLGVLDDISIEIRSGAILELLVQLEEDLDPSKLPWPSTKGICNVPADEVERISSRIHLKR
jgi:sporulation protein YlmC with PRC-barrel domain